MREFVLRVLRVPPAPSMPPGERGTIRVFRAAGNYLRYRVFVWGFTQVGTLAGLIFGLLYLRGIVGIPSIELGFITISSATIERLVVLAELAAWTGFVAQAVGSFALIRLDFEQRWYLVTDRSLRIREGLIRLNEKTMTFANIQNLSIEQGPIQRLLGIANLMVRSAGGGDESGGGKRESSAEQQRTAHFRGVDNVHEIRDLIRDRLRRHADAGLGDPDERAPGRRLADAHDGRSGAVTAEVAPAARLEAAQALLAEARALRNAMRRSALG